MKYKFACIVLAMTQAASLKADETQPEVRVIYAKPHAVSEQLTLSGSVEAQQNASLATLGSGVVTEIYVDAGDTVSKGQKLLALDSVLAQIELQQAQANLQLANVHLNEATRLYNEVTSLNNKKVIAKTTISERSANVEKAQANLAQAKANVALQQEMLTRQTLTAPFDGIIAQRSVNIGEWTGPQNNVMQLISNKNQRIFIDIPQEYYSAVVASKNIMANVSPDSSPSDMMQLPISQYVSASNMTSRSFRARIDLPENTTLISGMSAIVKLHLNSQQQYHVSLPKSALKRHPDGQYSVFSVVNSKVVRVPITLINSSFEQVSVTGVADESAVVISGTDLLKDGMLVRVSKQVGESK